MNNELTKIMYGAEKAERSLVLGERKCRHLFTSFVCHLNLGNNAWQDLMSQSLPEPVPHILQS